MVLWRPTRPFRTNTQKRCPFHYRGLECKSKVQEIPGETGKFGLGVQKKPSQRVLPRECTGHSKHPLPTTQEKTLTWTSPDGQHRNQIDYILCSQRYKSIQSALYNQQKQDRELTMAPIMNSLLPNSDLSWRKYGKPLLHSVQFSHTVVSDLLQPHELQHARTPCPSQTPWVYSNSCPSSRWCHLTVSSSVFLFSCLQSFPTSGSFQMSQLFTSEGQRTAVSVSTSVLPVKTQDWFPLGWSGWISLQSKGLSRVSSNTTVQKHQFFDAQLSL